MPTVLRKDGYRVYFYTHEPNEPPHVHVDKGEASAKGLAAARVTGEKSWFQAFGVDRSSRWSESRKHNCWKHGMGTLAVHADERVADVRFDADRIVIDLMDGRTIAAPLAWFPRLFSATPEQRTRWERAGGGYGLHWPDLDEDLSTEGLLRGALAADLGRVSEA